MTDKEKIEFMNNDFRMRVKDKVAALPHTTNWLSKASGIASEYLVRYRGKSTYNYACHQCIEFMDEMEEVYRSEIY